MSYESTSDDGLILARRAVPIVSDYRSLARDVNRGVLVKLRRGAYVRAENWEAADLRERHVYRIRAAAAAASRPVVIAGLSAAALWKMPIGRDWPMDVTVLDEWRGGGRSEPGVRRTAVGFRVAEIVEVAGLLCTNLVRTAIDAVREQSFEHAVGTLDWALGRRNNATITKDHVASELGKLNLARGHHHVERVLRFGTPLSDSFGESRARACIHLAGFVPPELQVEFRDAAGAMFSDFAWLDVRRLGEFDGKTKYTNNKLTQGDPTEVLWKEKKREDRLRALGNGITRILTSHVETPGALATLLRTAGVPMRSGW